jgi:Protein of unknown function (DUF2851)
MKILEKFLYEIWKEKNFTSELQTADADKIEVIDTGIENKDLSGPDFLNARIKIGNITFQGDVEIDSWHSDWKSHGHFLNKNYNKIILHVVLSKDRFQQFVYTREGRKVPSICLTDFTRESFKELIQNSIIKERKNRNFDLPCTGLNDVVTEDEKLKFLFELGTQRFKNKSNKLFNRLKEILYLKNMKVREPVVKYDFGEDFKNLKYSVKEFSDPQIWQQLIFELVFEALGYSKNKDIMLKLAKAVNIDFLSKFDDDDEFSLIIESALFNVSGLIPQEINFPDEETSTYVRSLIEKWSVIKTQYDGISFGSEQWHFFKLRPQNFPTLRIAGGARLAEKIINGPLITKIIRLFENENRFNKLTSELRNMIIIEADGFWKFHYVFDKESKEEMKYFIGLSRADEIIINVILPVMTLYFEIFSNDESARRAKKLYLQYNQKSSNQLVNQVGETLEINDHINQSVYYQGAIEIFRNYCVKERCLECKIGKKVFE